MPAPSPFFYLMDVNIFVTRLSFAGGSGSSARGFGWSLSRGLRGWRCLVQSRCRCNQTSWRKVNQKLVFERRAKDKTDLHCQSKWVDMFLTVVVMASMRSDCCEMVDSSELVSGQRPLSWTNNTSTDSINSSIWGIYYYFTSITRHTWNNTYFNNSIFNFRHFKFK